MVFKKKNNMDTSSRKVLRKVKGKWVAALLVATTIGGVALTNDSAQAVVNTAANHVMQSVASADFENKTTLLSDNKIITESNQALDHITSDWERNTVEEVQAEIERQLQAGLDAYVVQWGDTLSVLAQATNKSIAELANANNIGNWHLILTGDILQNVLTNEVTNTSLEEEAPVKTGQLLEDKENTTEVAEESITSQVKEGSLIVEAPTVEATEESSQNIETESVVEAAPVVEETTEDRIESEESSQAESSSSATESSKAESSSSATESSQVESTSDEASSSVVEDSVEPEESSQVESSSSATESSKAESTSEEASSSVVEDSVEPEESSEVESSSSATESSQAESTSDEASSSVVEDSVEPEESSKPESSSSESAESALVKNRVKEVAITHDVQYLDNNQVALGDNTVIQNGVDGIRKVTYKGNTDEVLSEEIIKEPVTEIIEVGTQSTDVRQEVKTEEMPFKTITKENADVEEGTERVIQEGQAGTKELTYTITYINGEEVKRELADETVVAEPIDRIVEVGTKVATDVRQETTQEEIPFETTYRHNSNLDLGVEEVVQEGQPGTKEITYNVTYENGEEVQREVVGEAVLTEPVDRIIEVGTKEVTTGTDTTSESIPFDTIRQEDPNLPVGTEEVVQVGRDGSKLTTYEVTYENGVEVARQAVGEPVISPATNEIIAVGTKAEAPAPEAPSGGSVSNVKYGVQHGDTMWSIANEFGTTPQAIADATGIRVDSSLRSGQTLIIPSAPLAQMDNAQAHDGRSIVMLDAGHGGWESGASSNGANEEDMNLNLAEQLTGELANRGYEVINTRTGDTTISLGERSTIGNASNADIFISLHHNALNGDAQGIETFYYEYTVGYEPSQNSAEHNDGQRIANSAYLAELIQEELIAATGAVDRGVKTDTFSVLRETDVPTVLVEFGFLDHDSERAQLLNAEYQAAMIQAVANAVDTYFSTVGY